MKVRYESEDGKVSGYGDEGKAAVEAYEADPLARFNLPWEWRRSAGIMVDSHGDGVNPADYRDAALLGSRLAPLVQELVANCIEEYGDDWHEAFSSTHPTHCIRRLEAALNETINA